MALRLIACALRMLARTPVTTISSVVASGPAASAGDGGGVSCAKAGMAIVARTLAETINEIRNVRWRINPLPI